MNNILDIAFKSMHLSDFVLSGKSGNFVTVEDLSTYASQEDLSGKSTVYVNGTQTDLSICKVSLSDYMESVVYESIDPQIMYIVSSDHVEAFGKQMKNLANGTEISDAVNLGQLLNKVETKNLHISGNIIQSEDDCLVVSKKNENAFIHVDGDSGTSYIGTRGWCILSIALSDSFVKLSGDATELTSYEGQKTTIRVGQFSYNGIFTVSSSIELDGGGNTIVPLIGLSSWLRDNYKYFVNTPENVQRFNALSTEEVYTNLFEQGANLFYLPEFPTVGKQESMYKGQTASGSGITTIESYAHAEGKNSLADGSYSHAEGEGSRAFGLASHAEGISCTATGTASHAEGYYSSATGNHSFAKGLSSQANGHCSFAFGQSLSADGEDSIALGLLAQTVDDCTFIWNPGEFDQETGIRKKYYSKGWGSFCVNPVNGTNGFYIGDKTLGSYLNELEPTNVISAVKGFSAGGGKVTGQSSMSLGSNSSVSGSGSIAVGKATASNSFAAAFGTDVSAAGWASFAHGNNTIANGSGSFASGVQVSSFGAYSFGQGRNVFIDKKNSQNNDVSQSQAFGTNVSSFNSFQTIIGTNARGERNHEKTFVWSATNSSTSREDGGIYSSHGNNTFNICPGANPDTNNIDNFYVGNMTVTKAIINSFGDNCVTIPRKSIAMGTSCRVGEASNFSYAIGYNSSVLDSTNLNMKNEYSFAIGTQLSACNRTTMVLGRQAKSTAKNQFVWGGKTSGTYTPVAGEGTFNINPVGDKEGFYIGEKNFISCVIDVIKENPNLVKEALGIA